MLQDLLIDDEIIFQHPFKTKYEITNHFVGLISKHDKSTARHSRKVAKIANEFAMKLHLSPRMIDDISTAALLHDIGKIKIPKTILNKPEKLTINELEIIKRHSQYGFEILKSTDQCKGIAEAVLCHHEKFNGKGYPTGKIGNDIPFIAQILSIVDVYEAITADRSYRKAMTQKGALQVICDGRETHFNATLANAFILGVC